VAAVSSKTINRRIKSVVNTRKITKAMELVAASKMRKAVAAVLATRPYASLAWQTVGTLTAAQKHARVGDDAPAHPLLTERSEIKRTLAVLVTSDRGLCGGFNAQILKTATEFLRKHETPVEWIAIGKRAEQFLRRRKQTINASFGALLQRPTAATVRPLARLATEGFIAGTYDEVVLLYTDFVSAILQRPRSKIMLPLRRDSELGDVGSIGSDAKGQATELAVEYAFEPDPERVLDLILPRILEVQFYQALLESLASEHSARMMAMRNATDSASEMIDDLRFTMNQARQAGITQEIAEISAGSAALVK
jgi:F-type H+-transporting ATPase subunit gamma